ncbi:MAG: MBL fold metallo-hydrolase [Geodermatophilaceae bacterium]|nr:MBL fold metallo-hydrolase [Geodermatophilaceae bacterium]
MRVTFCGVRGSTPSPGRPFVRYGGHTSCVALARTGQPVQLLLDAGTGMQAVSPLVDGAYDGSVLLGHLHWDHTHGMPFFAAGGRPGHRVRVLMPRQGDSGEALLQRCLSPPNFPIVPSELGRGWSFEDLDEGGFQLEGFDVLAREIPHKGGRTYGYRVSADGGSLAYLSDHSPTSVGPGPDGLGERHPAALELAAGVDVLIHDAQHRREEFPGVGYLGHASVDYAVALGVQAGVGTVVLFHHAPTRTDDEVDAMLAAAENRDVSVVAASEGLVLECVAGRPVTARSA